MSLARQLHSTLFDLRAVLLLGLVVLRCPLRRFRFLAGGRSGRALVLGSDLRGLLGFFRRYDRRAGRLAGLIGLVWTRVATIYVWFAAMHGFRCADEYGGCIDIWILRPSARLRHMTGHLDGQSHSVRWNDAYAKLWERKRRAGVYYTI